VTTFPRRPVLVLEDSDEDFDTVEEAARMSGLTQRLYRVMTGEACLELLQGSEAPPLRPSVLLLDLNTPGMSGREALVAIRAAPALQELPVVVLSTSTSPGDLAHCYGHGVNAYHLKPLRYDEHLQLLRDIFTYWLRRVELPESSGSDR
jgi:CheY-like chemotaxis protein